MMEANSEPMVPENGDDMATWNCHSYSLMHKSGTYNFPSMGKYARYVKNKTYRACYSIQKQMPLYYDDIIDSN